MTSDIQQLVRETIELTSAAPPELLDEDAPVLATSAAPESIYLIGLVGGKDVGKSSLVNAIVAQPITAATSYGPGTETVIAYAHESAERELRGLLEREVPGSFTIVTHTVERLRSQVLLDLPDIDSQYDDHIQVTRRMLRHMLYPLWIQSIEKYADLRPRELLAAVAEGNDPENFLFCLNKADQLIAREGPAAADELREDYAGRIARALCLPAPPQVYLISATHPEGFDLPALRRRLSIEKSAQAVESARQLAVRRQDRSLLGWFQRQRLPERAQQLARLQRDAEELVASRIALPLLGTAIPRLLDDPGQRMAMLAPAMRLRLSRWPIVNAIDGLLSPLLALVQKNLSASPTGSADPDAYLDGPQSAAASVQTTFAQLQQLHPQLIGRLYHDRKLWEQMHADLAAGQLRQRFAAAIERQRLAVMQRSAGRFSMLAAPVRWLLTIGAILWFPIAQPILSVMLQQDAWEVSKRTLRIIVDVLSVSHLLQCATFLLLWFLFLWLLLRSSAQRKVGSLIERWKQADPGEDLSLAGEVTQWLDELLEPIRRQRQRIEGLIERADALRKELGATAAPSEPGSDRARSLAAAT